MIKDDPTRQMAHYLADVIHTPLPAEVSAKTRQHILDTLAATISGSLLNAGQIAASFVQGLGGSRQASVPGTQIVTTAIDAAFAAAMAAHADETDDSHLGGRFHPGCAVVPAAIAVAEHMQVGGDRIIKAVTAGYDIGARATKALGFSAPRSGTHSTHCLGANFGAAAAAGVVAGLDCHSMEFLLSYATQQASGIAYWQRDTEHVEKAFDFAGMGARNGVFAALFVASGATAVKSSLTGEHSYLSAFAENADALALTDCLGERYEIQSASIKNWCVGSPIQAVLDAVMALLQVRRFSNDEIKTITVTIPDDRFVIVNNREMPDVCLQHLVALALVDGYVNFNSCHDRTRMQDPQVLQMRKKVKAVPSIVLTKARPARQAIVEIELYSGQSLRHHTRAVLGTPDNPMSQSEVESKANDLISPVLGEERSRKLIAAVDKLETVGDITELRKFWMLNPD